MVGLFIVIEGIDGAGKTTQALILSERIRRQQGLSVRLVHEPGGTTLGEGIEALVKGISGHPTHPGESATAPEAMPITPKAELLLFAASRAQLVAKVILPALQRGEVVISDRFAASTVAYQGYGRGMDHSIIDLTIALATEGLQPDLTILLDLDVKLAISRKKGALSTDRFEGEGFAFHEKVREGYIKMAAEDPSRWATINADRPREEVAEAIWNKVEPILVQQQSKKAK